MIFGFPGESVHKKICEEAKVGANFKSETIINK